MNALQFPLPPVPDLMLPIDQLGLATYEQLCLYMDQDMYRTVLTHAVKRLNPGAQVKPGIIQSQDFFNLFSRWNYTVKTFSELLEELNLYDLLYLFREQIPVQIDSQPPAEVVLVLQDTISLECSASGFPLPTFQWLFNGNPIDGEKSDTLTLSNLRTSNLGSYSCTVSQLCRDGSITRLSTFTTLKFQPYPPLIITQPVNQTLLVGDRLELICEVDSYPVAEYLWHKGDVALEGENSSVLKIPFANLCHMGMYSCMVYNTIGEVWTEKAWVTVENFESLRIIQDPTFPNDFPLRVGSTIYLECRVAGTEPIYYQWSCNGVPLSNQNKAALRIDAFPFRGSNVLSFQCEVRNGRDSLLTQIAVTTVDTSISVVQHRASIKLALLIGNWAYKNMRALEKVRADVKTLHDVLDEMEFKVIALCNLSKKELQDAVRRFCQLLLPGCYVLVYFAGHGIKYFNDYLMPVDVPADGEYSQKDLLDKNEIINCIQEKAPKLLTFLLDTCRVIPDANLNLQLYSSPPLITPLESRSNLIIGFATSENRAAYEVMDGSPNGVFVSFLYEEMLQRGVLVKAMLENVQRHFRLVLNGAGVELERQIPEVTSTLAEALSLHDPVDRNSIGDNPWNSTVFQLSSWTALPATPPLVKITIDGCQLDIDIKFSQMDNCFLNALKVEMKLLSEQRFDRIKFNPEVQPSCLHFLEEKSEWDLCRYSLVIHKLQSLGTEDEAFLIVSVAGHEDQIINVPLGRPLVANSV